MGSQNVMNEQFKSVKEAYLEETQQNTQDV